MPALSCVICERAMEVKKNDVVYIETVGKKNKPCKVWAADLFSCSRCGFEVVSNFGHAPLVWDLYEGFQENLKDQLNRGVPVFYCHEK